MTTFGLNQLIRSSGIGARTPTGLTFSELFLTFRERERRFRHCANSLSRHCGIALFLKSPKSQLEAVISSVSEKSIAVEVVGVPNDGKAIAGSFGREFGRKSL